MSIYKEMSKMIHYAAGKNSKEIGEVLISKGGDFNAIDIIYLTIQISNTIYYMEKIFGANNFQEVDCRYVSFRYFINKNRLDFHGFCELNVV